MSVCVIPERIPSGWNGKANKNDTGWDFGSGFHIPSKTKKSIHRMMSRACCRNDKNVIKNEMISWFFKFIKKII